MRQRRSSQREVVHDPSNGELLLHRFHFTSLTHSLTHTHTLSRLASSQPPQKKKGFTNKYSSEGAVSWLLLHGTTRRKTLQKRAHNIHTYNTYNTCMQDTTSFPNTQTTTTKNKTKTKTKKERKKERKKEKERKKVRALPHCLVSSL